VQSAWVKSQLEAQGLPCALVEIESQGDKNHTQPLYEIETATPGLFTKQLEVALEENRIDLAVHSLKDLPIVQPPHLKLAAITERVGAGDTLVYRKKIVDPKYPLQLPPGAKVGTSSLRREAQLFSVHEALKAVPVRGNVPTRTEFVRTGKLDAVILAEAGLSRLNLALDPDELATMPLSEDLFIPAPAQGALGIETRSEISQELTEALQALHHQTTATEVTVERGILKGLHGGCTLPLGVKCRAVGNLLKLKAFLGLFRVGPDGGRQWSSFPTFDISDTDPKVLVSKTVAYFTERKKE
jgi:hydroxymethylbilane synthase